MVPGDYRAGNLLARAETSEAILYRGRGRVFASERGISVSGEGVGFVMYGNGLDSSLAGALDADGDSLGVGSGKGKVPGRKLLVGEDKACASPAEYGGCVAKHFGWRSKSFVFVGVESVNSAWSGNGNSVSLTAH